LRRYISYYFYVSIATHKKNGFAEISKNLDTDLKIIILDHQNNYVKRSIIIMLKKILIF